MVNEEKRSNELFSENNKIWIAYLDELNALAMGTFKLLEIRNNWIFLETPENILIIPNHRILKIKKPRKKEEEKNEFNREKK